MDVQFLALNNVNFMRTCHAYILVQAIRHLAALAFHYIFNRWEHLAEEKTLASRLPGPALAVDIPASADPVSIADGTEAGHKKTLLAPAQIVNLH